MRFYFTLLICTGLIATVRAQEAPELQWLVSEYVKSIAVKGPAIRKDAQGNIFTISTQVHLNPLVGFILIKYGPEGDKLWERNYEGPLPHLYFGPAIDPEGNAYVSINYGGLPGLPTYTIILKYAPDGELLWEVSFEDWANNVTNLLAAGPQGLLYFAGGVSNTNVTQGYYVGCLDTSDGNILWKTEQEGQINPYNMKLLDDRIVLFANGLAEPGSNIRYHVVQQFGYDGELLSTGMTEDTGFYGPDFNGMTDEGEVLIGNRGQYTATKISIDGELLWHYEPMIYEPSFARGVTSDDSLNTYVTGGFHHQAQTGLDFVTTKISPTGDVLWESIYHSSWDSLVDVGYSIVVDSLYAYSIGSEGFDTNNVGEAAILIYDKSSGELLYNLSVDIDNHNANGISIVLMNGGGAFNGLSDSTTIDGSMVISGHTKVFTGYYKFSHPVSSTEIAEAADPFILYPNPARDVVTVQQSKRAKGQNVAELYDLSGHLLAIEPFTNREKVTFELGHLPSGMYVMKVGNQALKFNVVK